MGIADATHQASANAVSALGSYLAAFTAAAGTTGANEASGAGYGPRPQTTWPTGSMSGGLWVKTGSTVSLPVPSGTYTELGIWSAASAGTFVGSAAPIGGTITITGTGAVISITPTISG